MIKTINLEGEDRKAYVLPKFTTADDMNELRLSVLDLLSIVLSNEETLHKLSVRTCYYILELFKASDSTRDEMLQIAHLFDKDEAS